MIHKYAKSEEIPEDKEMPLSQAVELALQRDEFDHMPIDGFISSFVA